jgi:O-antigen ligase
MTTDIARSPVLLGALWVLIASSFLVRFDPAPYDVLAIGLAVTAYAAGLRLPRGFGAGLGFLALFVIANLLAAALSPEPRATLGYIGITFFLLFTWLLFTSILYENLERSAQIIWSAYLTAALGAVALGTAAWYGLAPGAEMFLYEGRASGGLRDANVFGAFLVPATVYATSALERGARRMWLWLPAVLAFGFGMLLSFSRGAWLNLAVALLVYYALRTLTARSLRELGSGMMVGSALAILAVAALLGALANPGIADLFAERAHLVQSYDVGDSGRFAVWRQVLDAAFQYPLGIGPGQSEQVFGNEAHNLYLHVLIETGWLGAIGLIGFLLTGLWRGLRLAVAATAPAWYPVVVASIMGALVENLFIHGTHWRHLYLLLALLWAPVLSRSAAYAIRPVARAGHIGL